MPRYEFLCANCGHIDLWRSFAEASQPAHCPVCQSAVKRVYTMPGIARNPAALTRALDRAHKSAHEPTVVKRQHAAAEEKSSAAATQRQHGRPWQVGH